MQFFGRLIVEIYIDTFVFFFTYVTKTKISTNRSLVNNNNYNKTYPNKFNFNKTKTVDS